MRSDSIDLAYEVPAVILDNSLVGNRLAKAYGQAVGLGSTSHEGGGDF